MELVMLLVKLMSSSGVGAALGWLGGLANRAVDLQAKKMDLEFERSKLQHELNMRDKDAAIMQLELAGKERISSIETAGATAVAGYKALQDSYDHDKSIAAGPKMTAFMKFIRPFVTLAFFVGSHAVLGWTLWMLWYLNLDLGAEFWKDMVTYVIGWEMFQASVIIGWWFANRPSGASEPALPQRRVGK